MILFKCLTKTERVYALRIIREYARFASSIGVTNGNFATEFLSKTRLMARHQFVFNVQNGITELGFFCVLPQLPSIDIICTLIYYNCISLYISWINQCTGNQ